MQTVIVADRDAGVRTMRWGLIPVWANRTESINLSTINAESETRMEKPMWLCGSLVIVELPKYFSTLLDCWASERALAVLLDGTEEERDDLTTSLLRTDIVTINTVNLDA